MFCAHSYAGLFTKQRDNMCFWSTAGTPMTPGQVPPETVCLLSFCYLFATCLLSVCYLFATCLLPLPSAVKRVRHVSDVYIAAPQGFPFRIPFISARWSPQVKSDPLSINPAMPDGLANASRPHSKLRTRSPLSGWFMMAFRALAGF